MKLPAIIGALLLMTAPAFADEIVLPRPAPKPLPQYRGGHWGPPNWAYRPPYWTSPGFGVPSGYYDQFGRWVPNGYMYDQWGNLVPLPGIGVPPPGYGSGWYWWNGRWHRR